MKQAGYSGTPLVRKLGINEGARVLVKNAPDEYKQLIGKLPRGVVFLKRATRDLDMVHLFVSKRRVLGDSLPKMLGCIKRDGMIWVSWHKKASKIPTEITEDVVREIALPLGLVDIKVCAVSEIWSGLKLVIRKELR